MKFSLLIATATLAAAAINTGHAASSDGTITAVTLYRGQAQIQRDISVSGTAGLQEIVVTNLPKNVIGATLFAESNTNLEIRAVRYRQRLEAKAAEKEVQQLDEELQRIQQKLNINQAQLKLIQEQQDYLKNLRGFVTKTATTDLKKGALDANTLQKLTQFQFAQSHQLLSKKHELELANKALYNDRRLTRHKRNRLNSNTDHVQHEAVIVAEKLNDKSATFTLNYIVRGTGWAPTYNLRGDSKLGKSSLEYYALINQTSGEDWRDVQLTLSTATPSLSATGPGLAPFPVTLSSAQRAALKKEQVFQQAQAYISSNRNAYQLNNAVTEDDNISLGWKMNYNANEVQLLELNAQKDAVLSLSRQGNTQGPTLSYPLSKKVTLLSRNEQQTVRIFKAPMSTAIYHLASPILNTFVYREGELKNSSGMDLLSGKVNVYLNREFVGKTEIPNVAKGQTFLVGFGADPSLRSARQLVSKDSAIKGGNQVITTRYSLNIENFADQALTVRLMDRIPYSIEKDNVRITLVKNDQPLSNNATYLANEHKQGILRWDINVPARSTGDKAATVNYSYQMEFDKNLKVAKPASKALKRMESDFHREQRSRKFR